MYLTPEVINPMTSLKGLQKTLSLRGSAALRQAQGGERSRTTTEAISGASVIFLGIVRNHSEGRKVLFLEYEAYTEMAESLLEDLIKQAYSQWPVEQIKLLHRTGRVELGQVAVAIEVLSAHRDEAYSASRFLIEEIKHKAPIWKKEYFEDGTSEWSLCQHELLSRHSEERSDEESHVQKRDPSLRSG